MQVEKRVLALVEEKIAENPSLFVVDIKMLPNNKLHILLDGDNGVSVGDCAAVSRFVGYHLEEENAIDHAYHLEVSSPGVGEPLHLSRQYLKNKGRNVAVKTINEEKIEGKLEEVTETEITLSYPVKEKGKKAYMETKVIPFEQITETKVLISFK